MTVRNGCFRAVPLSWPEMPVNGWAALFFCLGTAFIHGHQRDDDHSKCIVTPYARN